MQKFRRFLLVLLVLIAGSLTTACESPRDETSYQQGFKAGQQNGFSTGFESARPPGFSPESSKVRGILAFIAWAGAIAAGFGCFIFVAYLATHEEIWSAVAAKWLVSLLAFVSAVVVLAITAPENVIYFLLLAPAPPNYFLLIIITVIFSVVFYGIARLFVDTLERDLNIRTESLIIAAVTFIATMLVGSFVTSMGSAPNPSGYMICYMMVGCTIGVGAAGVRALIRRYEREKAANPKR